MAGGTTPLSKWARKNARIKNEYLTGFIGEFLGNLVLCLFAVGAVSSLLITPSHGYIVAVLGGVFGIMIAVTIFGGLSGAHINPAVSFGLAIVGELSWFKLPFYWLGQFLGSYVGAGLGYSLYEYRLRVRFCADHTLCRATDSDNENFLKEIIGIFSPVPSETPVETAFADQVVTTAVLLGAIMGTIDRRNMRIPPHLFGILFALVVAGIAFAFGVNAGGSMNPARDLGPRFMAVTIGCKTEDVFMSYIAGDEPGTRNNHYWLAPFLGPMLGAAIGALAYVFLVGSHLPDTEEEKNEKKGLVPVDSSDWRSTVFLPKVNQPSGPQNTNGYGVGAPYGNGVVNGGLVSPQNGGPYGTGVQNNGYLRDTPKV